MPLLSVSDASCLFRRPPGTIRRWIHEDEIQGQPDPRLNGRRGRRNLYPGDRLQDAYDRRTPRAVA